MPLLNTVTDKAQDCQRLYASADEPGSALAQLNRVERWGYRIGDWIARYAKRPAVTWARFVARPFVLFCQGKRVRAFGVQHLQGLDPQTSVILVANHRSFFDYYVVGTLWYSFAYLSKKIYFPVRAPFFYTRPIGILLNLALSGMAMFPPVLRDGRSKSFNAFSSRRCVTLLKEPGTILGVHPEGTRNKSADPYSFLPPKRGVGHFALQAAEAVVIPVFVCGLTNDATEEVRRTWLSKDKHFIDVTFGAPIARDGLDDQQQLLSTQEREQAMAERCMQSIAALAEQHRATNSC
jgi:1-acyl-sn-glycerol-3-phosphate acyltransferase